MDEDLLELADDEEAGLALGLGVGARRGPSRMLLLLVVAICGYVYLVGSLLVDGKTGAAIGLAVPGFLVLVAMGWAGSAERRRAWDVEGDHRPPAVREDEVDTLRRIWRDKPIEELEYAVARPHGYRDGVLEVIREVLAERQSGDGADAS